MRRGRTAGQESAPRRYIPEPAARPAIPGVDFDNPDHDLERLRAANGRLLEMLHGMCTMDEYEAVEIMDFVNAEWRPK